MIGEFIQSNNFQSGKEGWRITKSGGSEFNNVVVRGELYAAEGRFAFNGTGNTVQINNNGITVNLPGGGKVVVGRW